MRPLDPPESFAPLGGPINPSTETTPPVAPPVSVNPSEFVFRDAAGRLFTDRPANERAK